MKTVICTFNLFDLHQNVMTVDGDDVKLSAISNLENLGSDIAMICDKEDACAVHLYGSASYADKIIDQLKSTNMTKYNNRNIEIEVN